MASLPSRRQWIYLPIAMAYSGQCNHHREGEHRNPSTSEHRRRLGWDVLTPFEIEELTDVVAAGQSSFDSCPGQAGKTASYSCNQSFLCKRKCAREDCGAEC